MRQLVSHIPLTACALAAALLVSACGGGDASGPNRDPGQSGFAVDDYISGATVLCDTNGNGVFDAGEATTTTDLTGFFKFAATCASTLVVTGGTNIDTELPFVGKLKAPAGSTMVTPLTTLLAEGMTTDQLNTALGLPAGTDVKSLDPAFKPGGELENADLFRKTLAVQQVLQKTAETLAALAGTNDVAGMYSQAAAAMTSVLRSGSNLVSGDSVVQATVQSVVQTAANRVDAPVVAGSLAEVMAAALTLQAGQILLADGARAIMDTTKTQQGSTAIQAFVETNKDALQVAPGDSTASLASELMGAVSGGGVITPPSPPPQAGTTLISWDEATVPATGIGAFGDGSPSVAAAPEGGSGMALKLGRTGAMNYGGTFFGVPAIPFTADRKTITARVFATRANAVIYLKVEAGSVKHEVPATLGAANTWQTVTWNVSAANLANSYTTMVLSADTDVANVGAQTYWVDDITLAPAAEAVAPPTSPPSSANCATATEQCITFSEANAGVNPFQDLISAEVITDPASSNQLLKMVKGPSSKPWAGATVYTSIVGEGDSAIRTVPTIGLANSKTVTVRAYSGAPVGTKVTLKLENALGAGAVFAEALTTKQNEWETLTFNFASPSRDSFNASVSYDMASLFPAWSEIAGTQPSLSADTIFYFDELKYAVSAATPPAVVPPSVAGTIVADFDTVVPVVRGPDSGGTGSITAELPAGGGTGSALAVLRSGGQPWALNVLEATVPFAADRKTLSARVYSPTAGIRMTMKVEGTGGNVEVDANETVAVGWQTLTWTFNAAKTDVGAYNLLVILPNFMTVDPAPGKTYYYDDIKLLPAGESAGSGGDESAGSGGDSTPPGAEMGAGGAQTLAIAAGDVKTGDGGNTMFVAGEGLFSVNYVGSAEAEPPFNLAAWLNAKTASFGGINGIAGGDIGYFVDDVNLTNSSQKVDEGGWVAGTAIAPLGVPNFFRYYVLKGPVSNDAYLGAYVNAPNNGTVDVTGFGRMKIKVWGPAPMFERSINPVLQITLTGPKVEGCTTTSSGGSEITQNLTANLKNGAGGFYTLPLNGFTVKGLCGGDSSPANVLAKLARVVVTVPGTSFNRTEIDGGNYTTGVNLGPIGFTNK